MPFTVKEFPDQLFKNIPEYEEAKRKRRSVEESIAERSEEVTHVTATVIPAPTALLERTIAGMQRQISDLRKLVSSKIKPEAKTKPNREGVPIGTVLQGESRGKKHTLEVLDEDYLCSDGTIYQSLSGAALGVSGNRRSGWKFWRDIEGNPIGKLTGRFKDESRGNPFRASSMS